MLGPSISHPVYSMLSSSKAIAPLLAYGGDFKLSSGGIFVASSTTSLTVRWSGIYGTYSGETNAVNFSATLYADGHIRFSYGAGNIRGGWIGVSSGTGECTVSERYFCSMDNAADIILTPENHCLPYGLTMTADGLISGMPKLASSNEFTVIVTDANGAKNSKTYSLEILPDGFYTEEVDGYLWSFAVIDGVAILVSDDEDDICVSPAPVGEIVIPSKLGGCPVVDIFWAFVECETVTSVELPSSVTNIDMYAFYACTGLTSVSIPQDVTSIGKAAFYACQSLECVNFSEGLVDIGRSAFEHAGLRSLRIPDSVRNLGSWAFAECSQLTEVDLGKGVTNIGADAFSGCGMLKAITIPSSVVSIGVYAFDYCPGLRTVYVEPGDSDRVKSLIESTRSEGVNVDSLLFVELDPSLVISPSVLPTGYMGTLYSVRLSAEGGTGPYQWSVSNEGVSYKETSEPNSFAECGVAQGWKTADQSWRYELPFAFPFYGNVYTNVYVSSLGALAFDGEVSSDSLSLSRVAILPSFGSYDLSSGDVFIESSDKQVMVRWCGVYDGTTKAVNFAVTLYADGLIRFAYGEGNAEGGEIGLLFGDGSCRIIESMYGVPLANVADLLLIPRRQGLPSGLTMTEDGLISGTPTATASNEFTVVVTDANGVMNRKIFTLVVDDGTSVSEPIPDLGENPTAQEIADALVGTKDAGIRTYVTNAVLYGQYRTWAQRVAEGSPGTVDLQAVKDAPHAWLSFALDSGTMILDLPKKEDVKIEQFAPSGENGKFDFTLGIDGVNVGSQAVEECLKAVFGIEGGSSLEEMSPELVSITFGTPEKGKVKFTAGPKDTTQPTFFMKVKMTP